jgi:hypothetical protein
MPQSWRRLVAKTAIFKSSTRLGVQSGGTSGDGNDISRVRLFPRGPCSGFNLGI